MCTCSRQLEAVLARRDMNASRCYPPEWHRLASQLYRSSLPPRCSIRTTTPDGSLQTGIRFAEHGERAWSMQPSYVPIQLRRRDGQAGKATIERSFQNRFDSWDKEAGSP